MAAPQISILLADDDKDDCLFFKDALEELSLPVQLTTVYNGVQLMELLKKKTAPLPDVLFLDLNMPRKNGHECLVEIRNDKKLMLLPVIIFSTSYEKNIADLLYKNGAHYYICKPAVFENYKKIIQQALVLVAKKNSLQPPREKFLLSNLTTLLL